MKLIIKKKKSFPSNNQEKLIRLCLKNNKKAQLTIYNQYNKAMYNICLYMVKDSYVAEELMQDAFISAFEKLSTFKGEVSLGAWIKKIVINKCLDHLKIKRNFFESLNENYEIASEEESDNVQIEYKTDAIKEAIFNLPKGYRTIVTLYLLEGYDHEEIAVILDISPSTSRSQYTRAKALLQKILKEK